MDSFLFYQSFLDLADQLITEKLSEHDQSASVVACKSEICSDDQIVGFIPNKFFRYFLLSKLGKNISSVKILSKYVLKTLIKPQHLITDHSDYYVAIDMSTRTGYICYKKLLMLDLDFYKIPVKSDVSAKQPTNRGFVRKITRETLIKQLITQLKAKCHKDHLFKIFSTRNGIHAFLISHPMDRIKDDTIKLQLEMGSDFYYIIYSYLRGWSVRLNRKRAEIQIDESDKLSRSNILYRDLGTIGTGQADKHLIALVDLHIKLSKDFIQTNIVSAMYGG